MSQQSKPAVIIVFSEDTMALTEESPLSEVLASAQEALQHDATLHRAPWGGVITASGAAFLAASAAFRRRLILDAASYHLSFLLRDLLRSNVDVSVRAHQLDISQSVLLAERMGYLRIGNLEGVMAVMVKAEWEYTADETHDLGACPPFAKDLGGSYPLMANFLESEWGQLRLMQQTEAGSSRLVVKARDLAGLLRNKSPNC